MTIIFFLLYYIHVYWLDIFKSVVAGKVTLYLENLVVKPQDAISEFHVGEIVYVAERTLWSSPNPEYGPAQILKRYLNNSLEGLWCWVYDGREEDERIWCPKFANLFLQIIDVDEMLSTSQKEKRRQSQWKRIAISERSYFRKTVQI